MARRWFSGLFSGSNRWIWEFSAPSDAAGLDGPSGAHQTSGESLGAEIITERTLHVKPAVNRQPGYRRGTRRAFSKRTAGKSAWLSNPQKIATTSARLETQTQSKSSKQSGNEQPASCHQKLARDTRKQTKQGKPNQLPANLKAQRRPATRSTQQPNAQNQQPDQ